jgi:hypothetical protein
MREVVLAFPWIATAMISVITVMLVSHVFFNSLTNRTRFTREFSTEELVNVSR